MKVGGGVSSAGGVSGSTGVRSQGNNFSGSVNRFEFSGNANRGNSGQNSEFHGRNFRTFEGNYDESWVHQLIERQLQNNQIQEQD